MQDELSSTRNKRIDETAAPGDPVTVVALFDTLPDAERALDALITEGYHRDRISLVASNATGEYDAYARRDDDVVDSDDMDAGEGAAVAGGTLVTLETTASGVSRAEDILVEHGSIDIEERSSRWRDAGWESFDERSEPYTPEAIEAERARYGVKRNREPTGGTRR